MALRYCDGFDKYSSDSDLANVYRGVTGSALTTGASGWQYLPSGGVNGGGAIKCNARSVYLRRYMLAPDATNNGPNAWWVFGRVSFHFKSGGNPGTNDILYFFEDTTRPSYQCNLITTAGELNCFQSNGSISTSTSMAVTSGANLHDGNWHFIEIQSRPDSAGNSTGTYKVWIDGTLKINFTGRTYSGTYSGTLCAPQYFNLGSPDTTGTYDDLICWDDQTYDNFPTGDNGGATRVIETLTPTGDTATAATPSTGDGSTNYQMVDDTGFHDGASTTLAFDAVNETDLHSYSDMTLTPSSIDGCVVNTFQYSVAGNSTYAHKCRSGSSTSESATAFNETTTASFTKRQQCFGVDPDTSSAWTESGVNSASFGFALKGDV